MQRRHQGPQKLTWPLITSPMRATQSCATESHVQLIHIAIKMTEWRERRSDGQVIGGQGAAQKEKLCWDSIKRSILHVWKES